MNKDQYSPVVATATEERSSARPRVVHVVTSSVTTRLMLGQLGALREAGYEVFLISNPGPELERVAAQEEITGVPVAMEREIALRQDGRSLWHLWRTFRRLRPDLVNAGTAKAGLLAGLAAVAAGVPVPRLHRPRAAAGNPPRGEAKGPPVGRTHLLWVRAPGTLCE